jgi:hypothetical protein
MTDEVVEDRKETSKEASDRWGKEISDSKKWFKKFHTRGMKVNKAFLDENREGDDLSESFVTRLNLFHANIVTLLSMLYGRIPKVEVDRRFADADDDVARVAGLMLTRILNTDIETAGEDIASVFRSSLQDRLLPGLGTARVQYQFSEKDEVTEAISDSETDEELAPEVSEPQITDEWVDIVYTHWKDVLWSPCRTYIELRWKAYRSYLTKPKLRARFPKVDLTKINFSSKGPLGKNKVDTDCIPENSEAEVWEIWDKDSMKVYWWTEGYGQLLDVKDDILGLEGFWPEPPPMLTNVTTSKYLPKSDYDLARDLYQQIDELESRITLLTEACKCVGVYDASNEGIQRIFNEGVENQLIPVKNWAQFSEKGGLAGVVDWVPLEDVVNTISVLSEQQTAKIQQLYQVTGMNDVMRGAAQTEGTPVSATERKIQANYGSIRIEALQNEFARWVSDTQALKAEIIAKHYQPYCIIQQSNIMSTVDGQNMELVDAAIKLIKDPSKSRWKITVRPETLAIADYAQLKADRVEFMMGLAQFLQSAAPLLEEKPEAMPLLMKMLKWSMAGFKGSSEIEGILDQAIGAMEKQPPQQKPDPEAQKAQMEMQKMQGEMQMQREEHQANMQIAQQKGQMEMQQMMMKFQLELKKLEMEMEFKQRELELKMQEMQAQLGMKIETAKVEAEATEQEQAAQFAFNTAEKEKDMEVSEHAAQVQMESGDAELDRDRQRAKLKPKSNGDAGST